MVGVIIKFALCAAIIFYCGRRVAKYGDAIAEKTGLGGLWIGVILVSVATSLPELFTGLGSTVFVNEPDLTVGNLFGANTYNLVNISLLDFFNRGGPLLSAVSSGQLLTAVLSLIPLTIAALGILLTHTSPQPVIFNISAYSILILLSYIVCTRIIFVFENKRRIIKETRSEEEELFKYGAISLKTAAIRYAVYAAAIAGAGIWLAYLGDDISGVFGLEKNFVGSLFLGFATTLPEITVSVAAIRLGAKELAVANMVGSNLFNMTIIFFNDLFYRRAPIFEAVSDRHIFTACVVVVMTAIVAAGLILKPKKKKAFGLSGYSIALIAVFILGAYLSYTFSAR